MEVAVWTTKFNNQGAGLRRVRARFAHSRTRILGVGLEAPGAKALELRQRGLDALGSFEPGQTAAGGSLRLRVAYTGEAPRPVSVRYSAAPQLLEQRHLLEPEGRDGQDQAQFRVSGWSVPMEADTALDGDPDFDAPAPTPEEQRADRLAEIKALFDARDKANSKLCQALRYFSALDRRTDPDLAPVTYASLCVPLMQSLWLRVETRAAAARISGPAQPQGLVPVLRPAVLVLPLLVGVSNLFRELKDSIYPLEGPEGLAWAFELFASGRLATHHPDLATHRALSTHGVPDSLNYLMFAELALACLEADTGVDADLWSALLPTLVATSAFFLVRDPATGQPGGLLGDTERLLPMAAVTTIRATLLEALGTRAGDQRALLEEYFGYVAGQLMPSGAGSPSYGGVGLRPIQFPPQLEREALQQASRAAGSL